MVGMGPVGIAYNLLEAMHVSPENFSILILLRVYEAFKDSFKVPVAVVSQHKCHIA